jgi:hypothetical protein
MPRKVRELKVLASAFEPGTIFVIGKADRPNPLPVLVLQPNRYSGGGGAPDARSGMPIAFEDMPPILHLAAFQLAVSPEVHGDAFAIEWKPTSDVRELYCHSLVDVD